MAADWPQTAVTTTARMGGAIAIAAAVVHRRLRNAPMVEVFITQIVQPPERQVQLPSAQASRDMRATSIATEMASDANKVSK